MSWDKMAWDRPCCPPRICSSGERELFVNQKCVQDRDWLCLELLGQRGGESFPFVLDEEVLRTVLTKLKASESGVFRSPSPYNRQENRFAVAVTICS